MTKEERLVKRTERLKVREANRAIALMWATDGIITPHADIRRKMRLARLAQALNGVEETKQTEVAKS